MHVKPLSKLFRGKFRAALKKSGLFEQVPATVWHKKWVVHCKAVGNGQAALKYLAPYISRVAISNRRIIKLQDGQVTFRYRPSGCRRYQSCTLPVEEFMRRFLQHTLPKGLVKVRYYGFFSSGKRPELAQVRRLLRLSETRPQTEAGHSQPETQTPPTVQTRPFLCPTCGQPMLLLGKLKPTGRSPPATQPANVVDYQH